jgi:predicted nucleic acid-binding protein
MGSKVYLDANVVLDFLISDRKQHDAAIRLVAALSVSGYEVVISEDILTTVFYIAKDKEKVLEFFLSVRQRWRIVSFGEVVVAEGLELAYRDGMDLEDTLQCLCAKKEGCALIVTEDRGFVDCGVEVMDYEAALRALEAR